MTCQFPLCFVVPGSPSISTELSTTTSTVVFLVWDEPIESVVTDYEIRWASNQCSSDEVEEIDNISGNHTNYTIPNLRPGYSYNVSLIASNEIGSSQPASVTMTLQATGESNCSYTQLIGVPSPKLL